MSNATIFVGSWINWSSGPVFGATLTTTGSQGFLLVSFLTLFVRMAGGHFWSILCFIIHQSKSSAAPQDGLHHQQQLLLRNSQSHTNTLWDLIKVAIYWRSNAKRGFWRTIPLISLAILHLVIWTGASLFSSHVASTANEVLVQSPYCGYMTFANTTSSQVSVSDNTRSADNYIYRRTSASLSSNYARGCYANMTRPQTKQDSIMAKLTSRQDTTFNVFATTEIYSTFTFVDCPFSAEMWLGSS